MRGMFIRLFSSLPAYAVTLKIVVAFLVQNVTLLMRKCHPAASLQVIGITKLTESIKCLRENIVVTIEDINKLGTYEIMFCRKGG